MSYVPLVEQEVGRPALHLDVATLREQVGDSYRVGGQPGVG